MTEAPARPDDSELVEALRAGDEAAFREVYETHTPALLRLARTYAPSQSVAEEIVGEAWLGALKGLERFEGRSSFKTWLFRILVNTAKTRGVRESRSIPFASAFHADGLDDGGDLLGPDRFLGPEAGRIAGHWQIKPAGWGIPEEQLAEGELRDAILAAIDELPGAQREVIALRDLAGWTSKEVCNALEIGETNQRVLLHRARTKVRAAVEDRLGAVIEP